MARGAQEQIATFFASDGAEMIQPEPARFFEMPIAGALPEDLNFISMAPPSPAGGAAPATRASTHTSSAAFTVPLTWPYGPQVNLPPADSADGTASTSSGADN